jgi:hypothetical protein
MAMAEASRLDFVWCASNRPSGGYLAGLALDAASRLRGIGDRPTGPIDLHVLRLAAADAFDMSAAMTIGDARIGLVLADAADPSMAVLYQPSDDRRQVIYCERHAAQPEFVGHGSGRSRFVVRPDEARQLDELGMVATTSPCRLSAELGC